VQERGTGERGRTLVWAGRDGAQRPRATVLLLAAVASLAVVVSFATSDVGPTIAGGALERPSVSGDTDGDASADTPGVDALPAGTAAAWTRSRLPEGFAAAVGADERIAVSTLVRSGTYPLVQATDADGDDTIELPDGWYHPVELLALDPASYDEVVDRDLVGELAPDEALLSVSSAQVRGIGAGGRLTFEDGTSLRVAGVVADELVGAGEVIVRADGPLVPDRERYLLLRPTDPAMAADDLEALVAELVPEDRPLGFAVPGEVPVLRNSAAVLAPSRMKTNFGEFAMRQASGRSVQIGASWAREHIVIEEVPILGRVNCHRELIAPLRAAMRELRERGLEHLVDRSEYGGCWIGRTQGGDQGPLSSHAWGVAVDLNVPGNFLGEDPSQDLRLVEVMARHGFAWGGDWLVPDGMHFELVPDREPPRP
jgi:hypothetical protein